MATSDNILTQVITYNEGNLAYLDNLSCLINTSNKKFKDFDNMEANLGSTVSFDLPPRFTTKSSLVASFQSLVQRVHNLSCDQEASTSYVYSSQQFIFNLEDYMDKFGKSAVAEIGSQIESNVAENFKTAPYRFYGDADTTLINSYQALATALAQFRTYGAAPSKTKAYLPDVAVPGIITTGLSQFVMRRNEEEAKSWELGNFSNCDFYTSNLLPVHTAGSEGQADSTLTVVSVGTDPDDASKIISITFSGCASASDPDSVKENDRFEFDRGVSGVPNVYFLTFVGHKVSAAPVQFRATADAASTGASQVTVLIDPPLQSAVGPDQNLSTGIEAGMQVSVLPNHRVGCITSGDPLFLAMPRLPDQNPFATSVTTDPDTGASLRQYFGTLFGQNQQGMVHDAIWGSTLVPEYSMALIFQP